MSEVRTRIAPSPTGDNLHIGNAYTALINYVFAKKNNGKFLVRIEDTDRTRLVPGSEQKILESLKWLGLPFDEGPDIGGPFAPYRQSERLDIYKRYSEELINKGKAYYCFCIPERLEQMRKGQKVKGIPTMYDGCCKKLKAQSSKFKAESEKFVIRLNVPEEGTTEFTDLIRGKITFENKLIDDQVLIKSDGFPTYHFGVVVDDYLMKISHVIRGEEWISSVPKHILLYQAFGWKLPKFAHLPLLRNPDKSKLSKRKNPVWVSWYKEQGFLPQALLNYLALMGWSMSDGRDKFSIDEMIKEFRLEDIKTTAPIFDIEKLKWLNKRYIQEVPIPSFVTLASGVSGYSSNIDFNNITSGIAPLIMPRISTIKEFDNIAGFYFQPPQQYEQDLSKYKDLLKKIHDRLGPIGLNSWKADNIGNELQTLAKELGISNSEFFMVLRIAISGKKVSPPLNESLEILGKEEVLLRLSKI